MQAQSPEGKSRFNTHYPKKTGECTPDQRQEYELGLGPPETYRLGDSQKTVCDLLSTVLLVWDFLKAVERKLTFLATLGLS